MNTNRKLTMLLSGLLLLTGSAVYADSYNSAPQKIREVPDYPEVDVEIWTSRGDGSRYCAGESIEVFFRTNVDAWVEIHNIDTRGRLNKLFPSRHASNHFVRGGVVHRLPSRYGYHFEVEGPSGWETLRAVASTDRYALNDRGWNYIQPNDGRGYGDDYRPTRYTPASSSNVRAVPKGIREVPDPPRHHPEVVVAETRHYVRDGYRCRVPRPHRPWWQR